MKVNLEPRFESLIIPIDMGSLALVTLCHGIYSNLEAQSDIAVEEEEKFKVATNDERKIIWKGQANIRYL